ncbi:IS21 family transposase ISPpu7 [anaerobic digester metagenome]
MANRRFEMYEIRHVITRMRLGESDREIERAGLMGRRKAGQLRAIAIDQGWLDPSRPLPPNEELEALVLSPRAQQPSQSLAAPMAALICTWMERGIQATTIHEALVERYGFTGGYDSVKRFIRRNKKAAPATVFLEHPPAETAQVDFGAGPVIIDVHTGEVMKTWFFVMTLTCSKHMYVELVINQRVETWLGCHRRAFEHFGGTTLKVVIDNPKCAITRACYYEPEVQRAYAEFAEGYSFLISTCPPRDPQKKGVVESGVKYVKKSFQPLREFRDLADANRQLHEWVMGRAGNRIHGTTKQKPLVRFAEMEKDFLRPLPDIPLELACWASVKLHGNCHVQFEKAFYSAPFTLVHKSLWLRATEKTVQIFHEQQLVATHPRLHKPGTRSTVQDHMPPEATAYLMRDPQWCLTQAAKVGERCQELVEGLFGHRVLDNLRAVQGLLQLGSRYGKRRLEAACARAMDHGAGTYRNVKNILEKGLDQQGLALPIALPDAYSGTSRFSRNSELLN